ncbi:acyl-CoA--sterol O-acyltransferase 1-like [Carica papaya]|uniref:acyl-CoA--sterol O-acyltransferase 1-like n=1 Tax=Carica papaya TaxID=3649 RepID=UPI000B8CEE8B|nr:acyl-CoA--sterol O-acyltransferase 1-like [Carica papaya]
MSYNITEASEGRRREMVMEGEMYRIFKVWLTVFTSLCYCYLVGKMTEKGRVRLICVLPIVGLFLLLPLNLNSIHVGGTTAFFIAWLANFKLLLFAFGKGPLCTDHFVSLGRFVAVGCLPIKVVVPQEKQVSAGKVSLINGGNKQNPPLKSRLKSRKSPANYAVKCLLLAMIIRVYDYSEHLHPKLILVLYSFHIYFTLEIILAVVGALARALLGIELEPQFDEPYLSTSLQDFWGRRWNLMVTGILRPTVYEPTLRFTARFVSRRWTSIIAVMMTFTVSGLMHELVFFYLGRVRPTWEITLFFLLHGACLVAENLMRKSVLPAVTGGRWHIPKLVSGVLSIGWVIYTAFWLFFPPLLRSRADDRAFEEYAAVCAFLKNVGKALNS